MFRVVFSFFCLATLGLGLQEPAWPTHICTTLQAELSESSTGYLPSSAENHPDTSRIQNALNKCGSGKALKLVKGKGNAFLSGQLQIPTGVTLWIDAGVTLFASRNPRDYDKTKGSCGILDKSGMGCMPLIYVKDTKNSGIVGQGVIDGRGGQKMIGSGESWWELAARANTEKKEESCPRLLVVQNSQDFTLYHITFHNSPNFHVSTDNVKGLTVWSVIVDTPSKAYPSGTHARNTDAFDPNGQDIVFYNCYINTGDDHIAIKAGNYPVANVLVENCHFYKGHGMSIGSECNKGVYNVTVKNLSIDGADNGLRIKSDASRGGSVRGINYQNICIRNTYAPFVFDSYYSSKSGNEYPDFHDITVTNARVVSSGGKKVTLRGYNANYPLKISLYNVHSDVTLNKIDASNAMITEQGVSNINLKADSSKNVHVSNKGSSGNPIDCSKMFAAFPR